jgi:hypothetical protein
MFDTTSSHVSVVAPLEIEPTTDEAHSWNSVVFTSIPFVAFPVACVTADFLDLHDDWALQRPILDPTISHNSSAIYALHETAHSFTRYSNLDCIELYIDPRTASAEVVLVTNTTASQNNESSLVFGFISGSDGADWNMATAWICPFQEVKHSRFCTIEWAREFYDSWTVYQKFTTPDGQSHDVQMVVDHCLVGKQATNMADRCELLYNKGILFTVCVVTAVGAALILGVCFFFQKHTLVHVGDAVAEALENGSSLACQSTDLPSLTAGRQECVTMLRSNWSSINRPRWHQAVTMKSWIISLTL